jgi:hypothetical protein
MRKICFDDWKWICTLGIILLLLETLLVTLVYNVGYMRGDTVATRQCIEMEKNRKY